MFSDVGAGAGDITYEQFAEAIFAGASHSGQIWDHMLGWWEQRHQPNVLWVFFEDLKTDLRKEVGFDAYYEQEGRYAARRR